MGSYTICVAETHDGDKWVPAEVPDEPCYAPGEISITYIKCWVPRYALDGLWGGCRGVAPDDIAPSTARAALGLDYCVWAREEFDALDPDFTADEYADIADVPEKWQRFKLDIAAGLALVDAGTPCRLIFWVD